MDMTYSQLDSQIRECADLNLLLVHANDNDGNQYHLCFNPGTQGFIVARDFRDSVLVDIEESPYPSVRHFDSLNAATKAFGECIAWLNHDWEDLRIPPGC